MTQRERIGRIRITALALAAFLLVMAIVGRSQFLWPVQVWGMYTTKTNEYPPPTHSRLRYEVVTAGGDSRFFYPWQVQPPNQDWTSEVAFEYAFRASDPDLRHAFKEYVARLLRRQVPGEEMRTIRAWEVTWAVEPLAVPPMHLDDPARSEFVAEFDLGPEGAPVRESP